MHELYHVFTHNSGIYLKTWNGFKNDPYVDSIMKNLMEYSATHFQVLLGDSKSIYNRDLYLQKYNRLVQ